MASAKQLAAQRRFAAFVRKHGRAPRKGEKLGRSTTRRRSASPRKSAPRRRRRRAPPSLWRRTKRWVKKHPVATGLLATTATAAAIPQTRGLAVEGAKTGLAAARVALSK